MGGAMGWADDFRLKLYEYAWDKIKEHPVAGNGFILDVSEAVGILTVYNEDAKIELLAFGGSYHNTILELAVKLGLPAAFIFCFIAVIIPYRLYRQLLVAPPGEIKTWGMALLAFWVANTGMLLMNGSSREFFACMVVNGFMAALSVAKQEELSPKNKRNMPVNNKELVVGAGR
jgi:O-antigen ligase